MKSDMMKMQQVLKYIEVHLEENISLGAIAEEFGYSVYHFTRIFKENVGLSVMEYVTRRKMIKASEEILAGKKVIDAALKYGWESHSGFTKAFKKEFDFSPSLLKLIMIELDHLGGNAMNHVFLESVNDHAKKEELADILKKKMEENKLEAYDEELDKLYNYACNVYNGIQRYSGDEYVTHTLNVAIILAELEADMHVIEAGLFCDVWKKTDATLSVLAENVPSHVLDVIRKLMDYEEHPEIELSDEAAMVITAERLHNMRTVGYMKEDKRVEKAKETLNLFLPIARKIGNKKLLDELNELSLTYL